jgi:plasmid maintenance system antidote protein VapI
VSAAEETLRTQTRAALKAAGVRQTTAAAQLGVSEKHLSQMLTGRIALTLPWAERILAVCGMRLAIGIQYAPADDRADP